MEIISNSTFDAPFRQVLLRTFASTMKEVLSDAGCGGDVVSLEAKVAEAILALAATGQTSPGQLQRHAVNQVKSFLLTQSADRLFSHRSRSAVSQLRARTIL